MKRLFSLTALLCFAWFLALPAHAYDERNLLQQTADLAKLRASLVLDQKWVPYPAYSDREGWTNFLGDHQTDLIRNGEKRLHYAWKAIRATDYLEYERSGNRKMVDEPFNSNVVALTDLLLAELAEGKGRFIDDLINGVYFFSEMTSWVSPAHIGPYQASKRSLPDGSRHIIDLVSGDLSSVLAWTYYYMHDTFDKVNPTIAKRLRSELQARTLDAYMGDYPMWWSARNYRPGQLVNNWNVWCNFNVLQCYFLLENDADKLAKAVYTTMQSVDKFINYTHADGACEEGPSYWGHAAGKLYEYLQMLCMGTNGKINIFDQPQIRHMGEYIVRSYVGNGWVVNFADAEAKGGGDAALIFRFGQAVNSPLMMHFAAAQAKARAKRNVPDIDRDIFRLFQQMANEEKMKAIVPEFQAPVYTWYPETEFCYMTNRNGLFLATKGGYNDESHNHNDVGTFSLYLHTTPLLIDAGVGTYTRQTFSAERYSLWNMQSGYHNLPKINGVDQKHGKQFKAENTTFDARKKRFSLDIAHAYPQEAQVRQWIRTYTLEAKAVRIEDSFTLAETAAPNQLHFLCWGKLPEVAKAGEVIIEAEGRQAKLVYDPKQLQATVETIPLDDPRFTKIWGSQIYRITLTAQQMEKQGKYVYLIKVGN